MGWHLYPQVLQDAQIELQTTQWFWESTEAQVPALISATIQRIADQDCPFWEDNEEAILQRDRVEADMRRIARSTTLLQAWAIFEDAACWTAEERRRQGQVIGQRRPGESFMAWARRELLPNADTPLSISTLEWMEMLCRLRSIIIHTNSQYTRLKRQDRDQVDQWIAGNIGMSLHNDRIELSASFVSTALQAMFLAIAALCESFRQQQA